MAGVGILAGVGLIEFAAAYGYHYAILFHSSETGNLRACGAEYEENRNPRVIGDFLPSISRLCLILNHDSHLSGSSITLGLKPFDKLRAMRLKSRKCGKYGLAPGKDLAVSLPLSYPYGGIRPI